MAVTQLRRQDFFFNIEKETKIDHMTESWKSSGSGSGNNAVSAAFELLVRIGLTESDIWPASS